MRNLVNEMTYRVIGEWHFNGISVLQLDKAKIVTSVRDDYRFYRIGGVVYKPVPMSHPNSDFIAIKDEGTFIGKEVEFIKEGP